MKVSKYVLMFKIKICHCSEGNLQNITNETMKLQPSARTGPASSSKQKYVLEPEEIEIACDNKPSPTFIHHPPHDMTFSTSLLHAIKQTSWKLTMLQ